MIGHKREDGFVLVVMAAVLVVLLGFATLAVDIGILYGAHTAAQRAADAAALAGAFTFISAPSATDPVALATDRALKTARENQILGATIQTAEVNVAVDYPNRMVTVDVTHPVSTFFAKALFVSSATVHAQGIAEAALNPTGSKCVKPWFVPNSIVGPDPYPDNCTNQAANLLVLSPGNTKNTALFLAMQGQQFVIKPGNPSAALAPGQFFAIDLGEGPSGGDEYRDNIATCPDEATIFCLNSYSVKTGNMIGPTKQGVEALITKFDSVTPDAWAGFNNNVPLFIKGGTNPPITADTSHQLVVAPLWDICTTLDSAGKLTGTNLQVPVVGFAFLFIEGVKGNDVIVRLIDVQACGENPPTTTETGPFAVPLRLVRVN